MISAIPVMNVPSPPCRRALRRACPQLLAALLFLLEATTAARAETTFIARGSVWSYLDDGSDQGAAWQLAGFDDSAWPSGPARLGYGEGDEATVIASGVTKPTTIYFRHKFASTNPPQTLTLRLQRDDGGIVYLNGIEIFRSNMPEGAVDYLTPALRATAGADEDRFFQYGVYSGYLVNGENVLAVEVHQDDSIPHDCSFDLELLGGLPITPPIVQMTAPADRTVFPSPQPISLAADASDLDGHIYAVEYYNGSQKIAEAFEEPYSAVWFNAGIGRYALTAKAIDYLGRRSYSAPVHIQVGLGLLDRVVRGPYLQMGTPTNVVVCWRTDWLTDSRVVFGTNAGNLDRTAIDSNTTAEHAVCLTELRPNTRYYYAIGTSQEILLSSPNYFFVTAPTNGQPVRIWAIGDFGTADARARAVATAYDDYADGRVTDVWLMLGDNAYEEGTDDQYQRAVFETYSNLLCQAVVWPTIGNHDASLPDVMGNIAYLDIFNLPRNAEAGGMASGTERYYSFDYANIHFVCLDSATSDRSPGSPMFTWLENDLAATAQDWIIAFWHHPPYSMGTHRSDFELDLIEMRENALPILERYGADLILAGHSHVYERSYLVNGHYGLSKTLTPAMIVDQAMGWEAIDHAYQKPAGGVGANRGTVYTVCGCSGEGGVFSFPQHPVMARAMSGWGSVVIDVSNLRLEARFLRDDGTIDDAFAIEKGLPTPNALPRLQMNHAGGGQAQVTWPTSLLNFNLEARDGVEAGGWATVTNAASTFGRRKTVTIDTDDPMRLFRLNLPFVGPPVSPVSKE